VTLNNLRSTHCWEERKVGDVITLEYGKSLKDYQTGGGQFEVFGTNGKIGFTDGYLYDQPSLVIGRKGAYRGVHLASRPFFVIDTAFYTKSKLPNLDILFLYYWFLCIDINAMDSGSAIPSTSREEVYDLDISLPSIEEQKAIASVLSSLDDKIDLLNRQNKTLEDMAESLFRQWFVEGAQEGWKGKPLSDIANFLNGLACQKYPPENDIEKLPVLKIRELQSGISESSDFASSKVDEKYIVEAGDVVFSWSASLVVKIWDGETCVLNQHLFKVTSAWFPKWFYLMWCRYHLQEFIAISQAHATTMGHIKRRDLDQAMVLVPSPPELQAMTVQIEPIIDKQIFNSRQIKQLTKLRDMLLPKLISGEVRVA